MTFTSGQSKMLWLHAATIIFGAFVLSLSLTRHKEEDEDEEGEEEEAVFFQSQHVLGHFPGAESPANDEEEEEDGPLYPQHALDPFPGPKSRDENHPSHEGLQRHDTNIGSPGDVESGSLDPDPDNNVRALVERSLALEARCEAAEQRIQELQDQVEESVSNMSRRQQERRWYTISPVFDDEETRRKETEENLLQMNRHWERLHRSKAFQELKRFDATFIEFAQQQIEATRQVLNRYSTKIQEALQMKVRFDKCLDSYHRLLDTMEQEGPKIRWLQQVVEQERDLRLSTDELEVSLILASEGVTQDNSSQEAETRGEREEVVHVEQKQEGEVGKDRELYHFTDGLEATLTAAREGATQDQASQEAETKEEEEEIVHVEQRQEEDIDNDRKLYHFTDYLEATLTSAPEVVTHDNPSQEAETREGEDRENVHVEEQEGEIVM